MKSKIVEYADNTRIPCICEVRTANMIRICDRDNSRRAK